MSSAAAATPSRRPGHQPRLVLRYASFEARVVATMVDALVALIIVALLLLAGSLVVLFSSDFERVDPSDTALYTFWGLAAAAIPAVFLYQFLGLAWKGQTLGAAVMQIMVIRSDGRPLGAGGAMARVVGSLAYPVVLGLGILGAYALDGQAYLPAGAIGASVAIVIAGIVWAAFDSRRRMLHDRLAGTVIVRLG